MQSHMLIVTPDCATSTLYTEHGVCANQLRQECCQSAGHPKTRELPWHHRAEGWCADHTQVTHGVFTWRQLRCNPNGHHKEHRPRSGQAQRGEIRNGPIAHITVPEVMLRFVDMMFKADSPLVQYIIDSSLAHIPFKYHNILSDRWKPLSSFPWTSVITSWLRSATCWGPESTWRRPLGENWRRWANTFKYMTGKNSFKQKVGLLQHPREGWHS